MKAELPGYPNWKKQNRKRELPINMINNRYKARQQNTRELNPIIHKRIIHLDQVRFILEVSGWFSICKSINLTST